MELRILTPEDRFLKAIDFNFEEIRQELSLRLEKYKNLVYTDEQIKEAKTDRATLNKFVAAIEAKRKEIKLTCMEPYMAFENKIREITAMVEAPCSEIDKQVKAYEEKQKDEKKAVIEGVYAELINDLKEILPLKKLWNEKWLNVTYKLSSITEEISEQILAVQNDLQVIETIESEFKLQTKDKYLQTLNLSAALAEKARLEESARKLKEYEAEQQRKRQEAEEKRILEEKERQIQRTGSVVSVGEVMAQKVNVESELAEQLVEAANNAPIPEPEPILEQLDFRVWVTLEQKRLLREFLINCNIRYGRVD